MDPLEAIHLYYMIKHDTKNPNKVYYMKKVNGCLKSIGLNNFFLNFLWKNKNEVDIFFLFYFIIFYISHESGIQIFL